MTATKDQMRAAMNSMKEREEPRFVEFKKVGDSVTGLLLKTESIEITDKETGRLSRACRYLMQDPETGERLCFLGTYQINQKLSPADRGRMVTVKFNGLDQNVVRNGNAMRDFKVLVSEEPVGSLPELGITDDDIPF